MIKNFYYKIIFLILFSVFFSFEPPLKGSEQSPAPFIPDHIADLTNMDGSLYCRKSKIDKKKEKEETDPEKEKEETLKLGLEKNTRYKRIRELVLGNNFKEAKKELSSLYEKYPEKIEEDKEYHYYTGLVLESQEDYSDAVNSYMKAIEISPDYSRALNGLGNLYRKLRKHYLAQGCFKRALDNNPYNPFINFNLGDMYYELGDLDNAVKYLKDAIKYKKNFGSAYHLMGCIMFKKREYMQSLKYFNNAIKFKKVSHLTYYYSGLASYKTGNENIAILNLKKSLNMKKSFFEAYFELGKIYQESGDYKSALYYLLIAKRIIPDYIRLNLMIVNCYNELSRHDDAIEIIKEMLKENPGNEILKRYLKNQRQKRLKQNLQEDSEYYQF